VNEIPLGRRGKHLPISRHIISAAGAVLAGPAIEIARRHGERTDLMV